MFIQGELIYQYEKFLWYYFMFIKHFGSCEYSSLWAHIISAFYLSQIPQLLLLQTEIPSKVIDTLYRREIERY